MKFLLSITLFVSFALQAEVQWATTIEANPLTFSGFGDGIANMDMWLVVGDPLNDDQAVDSGAVYVYHNQNGQWVLYQTLYADDAELNDQLGSAVDIERYHVTGETWIVASALNDDDIGLNNGAVYAFQLDMNGDFIQRTKFTGEALTLSQNFGKSIAINYDYFSEINAKLWVLVVGDDGLRVPWGPSSPNTGNHTTGGVSIYKKTEGLNNYLWEQEPVQIGGAYLDILDTADLIGTSVSIDGKYILAGAPGDDSHALGTDGVNTGAMHLYMRDNLTQTWVCCSVIKADDEIKSAAFGTDVDVIKQPGNNLILIGSAPLEKINNNLNVGAAYVWYNSAFVQKLVATTSSSNTDIRFGLSIAANGDEYFGSAELLIGAPHSDVKKGRIYHYSLNPNFNGANDLYNLKTDIVAFNRNQNPWDTGQFGTNVSTDGRTHVTSSVSNYIGSHKSVYSQEVPIFANGFQTGSL